MFYLKRSKSLIILLTNKLTRTNISKAIRYETFRLISASISSWLTSHCKKRESQSIEKLTPDKHSELNIHFVQLSSF